MRRRVKIEINPTLTRAELLALATREVKMWGYDSLSQAEDAMDAGKLRGTIAECELKGIRFLCDTNRLSGTRARDRKRRA